jgi:hypothetical protein
MIDVEFITPVFISEMKISYSAKKYFKKEVQFHVC